MIGIDVMVSAMAIPIGNVNIRFDVINARINGLEMDMRSMDNCLRAVEITFAEVDQHL